jgi:hypothetical protein
MRSEPLEEPLLLDPHAQLEKSLIEEYLRNNGCTLKRLRDLPEETARRLMTEASLYASIRLTVVETRARFVHEVHGAAPSLV